MIALQYSLLFMVALVCAIGAALGYARGFAAPVGIPVWIVLANASTNLTVFSGGSEFTASSEPLFWLFMLVAAIHVVATLVAVDDYRSGDPTEDGDVTMQEIAQRQRLLGRSDDQSGGDLQ